MPALRPDELFLRGASNFVSCLIRHVLFDVEEALMIRHLSWFQYSHLEPFGAFFPEARS